MNELSWEKAITDPNEVKVFQALSRRMWRSLWAISRASGLPEGKILKIIAAHRDIIWESDFIVDTDGLPFYGLAEKVVKKREEIDRDVKAGSQRRKIQEQLYRQHQQKSQSQVYKQVKSQRGNLTDRLRSWVTKGGKQ